MDNYKSGTGISGSFINQSKDFADGVSIGILWKKLETRELLENQTIPASCLGEALKLAVLFRYRFEDITIYNDSYYVVNFYPEL